jgi:hypothetical protein
MCMPLMRMLLCLMPWYRPLQETAHGNAARREARARRRRAPRGSRATRRRRPPRAVSPHAYAWPSLPPASLLQEAAAADDEEVRCEPLQTPLLSVCHVPAGPDGTASGGRPKRLLRPTSADLAARVGSAEAHVAALQAKIQELQPLADAYKTLREDGPPPRPGEGVVNFRGAREAKDKALARAGVPKKLVKLAALRARVARLEASIKEGEEKGDAAYFKHFNKHPWVSTRKRAYSPSKLDLQRRKEGEREVGRELKRLRKALGGAHKKLAAARAAVSQAAAGQAARRPSAAGKRRKVAQLPGAAARKRAAQQKAAAAAEQAAAQQKAAAAAEQAAAQQKAAAAKRAEARQLAASAKAVRTSAAAAGQTRKRAAVADGRVAKKPATTRHATRPRQVARSKGHWAPTEVRVAAALAGAAMRHSARARAEPCYGAVTQPPRFTRPPVPALSRRPWRCWRP